MRYQKGKQVKYAQKHIDELFIEAHKIFPKYPNYAHKYISMALQIRNKFNLTLTKEQKTHVCKKCHHYLYHGVNCTVRTKSGMVVYHCNDCGALRKFAGSKIKTN